ncbi:MAG: type transport system permease protein [Sphingomonadales bacterium]|jgi:ABC-2 type transport system permease protein|nr:type transport system permease protein [Sphingomonadales bacterium]
MRWLEPGSLPWLALHEIRLAFRHAGASRRRTILRLVLLVGYAGFGIFLAYGLADLDLVPSPRFLVAASAALVLLFTFMLTQGLLGGQRTLYTAGDLDLLLSSPLPERRVLSAKLLGLAGAATTTFSVLLLPIALPTALWGHPRLLAVIPVIAALAVVAAAIGIGLAIALVRSLGARGAKSVGQIVAAMIGGLIFLLSQLSSNGAIRGSRFSAVSAWMRRTGWGVEGWSAWPARALFGELVPLLACLAFAAFVFWVASTLLRTHFLRSWQSAGEHSAPRSRKTDRPGGTVFASSLTAAVVAKELRLLKREPEILFSMLLRLIYLLPLVFFGLKATGGAEQFRVPVLAAIGAIAAGQLCGSLAWLTLSAEEAPDLLAVSPVPRGLLRRDKLLAAMAMMAPFALILPLVLAPRHPGAAIVTFLGSLAAGWAAGLIELLFGKPGKRSAFQRRQQGSFLTSLLGLFAALLIGGATAAAAYFV